MVKRVSTTKPKKKRRKPVAWTAEDDRKLIEAVEVMKLGRWKEIAKYLENKFTPNQCHQHYYRVVMSSIRKTEWNEEEDALLLKQVEKLGEHSWAKVAMGIAGRTDIQCRQRYKTLKKRLMKNNQISKPKKTVKRQTKRRVKKEDDEDYVEEESPNEEKPNEENPNEENPNEEMDNNHIQNLEDAIRNSIEMLLHASSLNGDLKPEDAIETTNTNQQTVQPKSQSMNVLPWRPIGYIANEKSESLPPLREIFPSF